MKMITILLILCALATALVAGIFYAFSSFVMAGLGRIPTEQGVNAMNSINVTVITPSFMLLFMGTTLLCLGMAVRALFSIGRVDSQLILAASLLYVIGCFGVTMVFNVPLNNQLAAVTAEHAPALWQTYLRTWTRWNTVRTLAPAISTVLFILALLKR